MCLCVGCEPFLAGGRATNRREKKNTHTREIPCADITATGSEGSNASVPGARVSQRTEADARTWRTTQVAHLAIASMLQFLTNFTRGGISAQTFWGTFACSRGRVSRTGKPLALMCVCLCVCILGRFLNFTSAFTVVRRIGNGVF